MRVADHVAMIHRRTDRFYARADECGRLIGDYLRFSEPQLRPPALAGALAWEGRAGNGPPFARHAVGLAAGRGHGGRIVEEQGLRLDEIFVALAGTQSVGEE